MAAQDEGGGGRRIARARQGGHGALICFKEREEKSDFSKALGVIH
jgi:hypothetical protein